MQRVGFLRRRRETLLQHDRDQAVDALRGALSTEIERHGRGKRLTQNHHRIHVGVLHSLQKTTGLDKKAQVFFLLLLLFCFFVASFSSTVRQKSRQSLIHQRAAGQQCHKQSSSKVLERNDFAIYCTEHAYDMRDQNFLLPMRALFD